MRQKYYPKKEAVYVIKRTPHDVENQIVLDVGVDEESGYLCFYDTNRGHMLRGKILDTTENSFSFVDFKEREWKFEEVTVEEFKENIYRHIVGGEKIARKCKTTQELWDYFHEKFCD